MGFVGAVLLPFLGLAQGLVEGFITLATIVILVIALLEVPGVIGRGQRKSQGSYRLDKVKKG